MSDCIQHPKDVTLYSPVYNLISGNIHVFNVYGGKRILGDRHRRESVILNLNDELVRGNHYYELTLLSPQMHESVKTYINTLPPIPYSEKAVSRISGTYVYESGDQIEIFVDDDRILMSLSSLPGRTSLLYQTSERLFFSQAPNL